MDPGKSNTPFVRQRTYFAILSLLNSITADKKYPDILIGGLFRKEDFSLAEKATTVEMVYGILRHRARIDHIIEKASNAVVSKLYLNALNIIRICTYQAAFMDTSPAGIINNAVALSSHEKKFNCFIKRTVEGVLRNKDNIAFPDKEKAPLEYVSIYHSHPVWIVKKWSNEFGDMRTVEELCRADNIEPPLTIRVNLLKTNRESLQSPLKEEGYPSSPTAHSPFGLVVDKKEGIFKTEAFRKGFFEVQDEGSQLVTLLTGAKPGEFIIDACAGNGGKSLFLSGLMKNKGTMVAFETHAPKLANLRRRAERAGASIIRTANIDETKKYADKADCVFIDAPCSGLGVFRRNPDSKWRLSEDDICELAVRQKEIIREYSRLVKPGGRLVYATCTISREENEEVVHGFLEENRDFYLVPASEVNMELFSGFTTGDGFFRSMPHVHNTDGFFGAVMKRRNRQDSLSIFSKSL